MKLNYKNTLLSDCLCIGSYLFICLTYSPVLGFIGIGLSGFAVGMLLPGTFSSASSTIKGGGTAMFALLALAGDLGCSWDLQLSEQQQAYYKRQLKIWNAHGNFISNFTFNCSFHNANKKQENKTF